jgi:hypothetical protein
MWDPSHFSISISRHTLLLNAGAARLEARLQKRGYPLSPALRATIKSRLSERMRQAIPLLPNGVRADFDACAYAAECEALKLESELLNTPQPLRPPGRAEHFRYQILRMDLAARLHQAQGPVTARSEERRLAAREARLWQRLRHMQDLVAWYEEPVV